MLGDYEDYIEQKRRQYGDRFDTSDLAPQFIEYFESGERIKVQTDEHVRTGTVGITIGWRPAFLLMHRSSDHSSGDVLGTQDQVTHVQRGRTYVPLCCGCQR